MFAVLSADGPDDVPGTEDDNVRLTLRSPAINFGDPEHVYVPWLRETDLDGHARVLCGRIDMGAYEFGIGDFDCDRDVDLSDLGNWSDCMDCPCCLDGCEAFDSDADYDVDLGDFAVWQNAFTGPVE